MRDSTNGFDIPVGTPIVAGYVDGLYAWSAAEWNHHPDALHFGISVYASGLDAHCADVETGDFTPEDVVDWALWRRSKGAIPYVYMNLSTWPRVINAFNARGVEQPLYWVADWDGIAQIFGGSVGKQYANPTFTGGHYDESLMADYLPGLDALPAQPAQSMAAGAVAGWDGVVNALDQVLPSFGGGLGVLSSELLSLG